MDRSEKKWREILQRKKTYYALAGGWTFFLIFALSIPGDSISAIDNRFSWSLPEGTDKGVHTFLFFFETLWLILAFRLSRWRNYALFLAVGVAVLLALGTESLQAWIPERSSHFADLVANFVGISLGVLIGFWKPIRLFRPETG